MKSKIIIALAVVASAATACSSEGDNNTDSQILVSIGKSVLTRADLAAQMPGGLSYDDSVKYARAYIRTWIDSKIITEIAAGEIDMKEIDRLVERYREDMIMWEYTSRMYQATNNGDIPEDSIRNYYNTHKDEFILESPMVKGIYIKVPDDAVTLPEIRRLYLSSKPEDIDSLEKTQLHGAMHYDYFRDKWVDWEQIETLIPYDDKNMSADRFLNTYRNLDFSQGGFTYLLDITDVLHTGQPMPYDVAKVLISERMKFQDRRKFDQALRERLFRQNLDNGTIRLNCELE